MAVLQASGSTTTREAYGAYPTFGHNPHHTTTHTKYEDVSVFNKKKPTNNAGAIGM